MTVPWLIGGVLLLDVSDIDERQLFLVRARKERLGSGSSIS
jgi:hypothetical protein